MHNKTQNTAALFTGVAVAALALTLQTASAETVYPVEMTADDLAGKLFEHPDTIASDEGGNSTLDITSLKSSDGRFATGLYKSGPIRAEITEPYGVDEFMYFLEGGVTLTSSDGTVTEITAGEGLTIPREWTGIWDTQGYRKIWVIYSEDGSGL